MGQNSLGFIMQAAELYSQPIPSLDREELKEFVGTMLDRRETFLALAREQGSPLYVIDTAALKNRANRFRRAFTSVLPKVRIYYALKSNSHPLIASTLVREGLGLDVSSGLELGLALDCGAEDIVLSGPGKQPSELQLALDHVDRVTVLMDSFAELEKLEAAAATRDAVIRAGVRLTTEESGIWKKFGIPLSRLGEFMEQARGCPHVDLRGLQFHISWNLNPESQVVFIARVGAVLRQLAKEHRDSIKFLDIGGGFWPEQGEWLQAAATPQGMIRTALAKSATIEGQKYFKRAADPISEFAEHIAAALRTHLPEDMNAAVCLEPGRWLCHEAMHILLTVADRKSSDLVITDGGTNAVGWERFESDYFPVINLTRPGLTEHDCLIAGSLCTPHDLWGYSYFGEGIREGDILLVPDQGAYTYSLRQEFIKPLPKAVLLPDSTRRDV